MLLLNKGDILNVVFNKRFSHITDKIFFNLQLRLVIVKQII